MNKNNRISDIAALTTVILIVAAAFIIVRLFFFTGADGIPSETSASGESSVSVTAKETEISAEEHIDDTTAKISEAETENMGITDETSTAETESTELTAEAPPEPDTYELSYFSGDLFIGDSIYTGLYLYGFFPMDQVFAQVGLNPQSARTALINGVNVSDKAAQMKPGHIFIMLGTNGLAYMNASFMAENMGKLAEELKAASPDSRICILSIPPVTYAHELKGQETMAMVNEYNAKLSELCAEKQLTYIDLCSRLSDDSGYFSSLYAEADGMHFLGTAYKKMLSVLQSQTQ